MGNASSDASGEAEASDRQTFQAALAVVYASQRDKDGSDFDAPDPHAQHEDIEFALRNLGAARSAYIQAVGEAGDTLAAHSLCAAGSLIAISQTFIVASTLVAALQKLNHDQEGKSLRQRNESGLLAITNGLNGNDPYFADLEPMMLLLIKLSNSILQD